jgi:hypothetical protein
MKRKEYPVAARLHTAKKVRRISAELKRLRAFVTLLASGECTRLAHCVTPICTPCLAREVLNPRRSRK